MQDFLDRRSKDLPPSEARRWSALFLEFFFLPCLRFRAFFLCLLFFFSFLCLGRLPDLPDLAELRSEECSGERDHAETLLSSHLLDEWSFSLGSQKANEGSRNMRNMCDIDRFGTQHALVPFAPLFNSWGRTSFGFLHLLFPVWWSFTVAALLHRGRARFGPGGGVIPLKEGCVFVTIIIWVNETQWLRFLGLVVLR